MVFSYTADLAVRIIGKRCASFRGMIIYTCQFSLCGIFIAVAKNVFSSVYIIPYLVKKLKLVILICFGIAVAVGDFI